ncbi:hypothetical protein A8E62_32055 [Burkholderia cenocepacia]|nr:hypothetical protein A8E62_32055 [Burkholderia cenocepacia]ONU51185.1 hypothetical protein A8E67_35600 [Burkholderia cenocepacia]ONU72304.1 hypothetical protein A8E63_39845 [Burkholderia cenocepacia]ONV10725.1 hypothetical protein A8E69_05855 [Burkholderia cenocepacia]
MIDNIPKHYVIEVFHFFMKICENFYHALRNLKVGFAYMSDIGIKSVRQSDFGYFLFRCLYYFRKAWNSVDILIQHSTLIKCLIKNSCSLRYLGYGHFFMVLL